MRTGNEETHPAIRPELPAEFRSVSGAVVRTVAAGIFLGVIGVVLLLAAVAAHNDRGDAAAQIMLVVFGLTAIGLGVLATVRFVRSVTMDDDGLTVQGFYQSRRITWDHVDAVELGYESKERKQRRAQAAGFSGLVGGAVGAAVMGASSGGAEGDHRQGDPYADGRLRRHYDPHAVLVGAGDRRLARLPENLGWALFTALRAEALARGIGVRRKSETGGPPRRRRR